MNKLQLSLKVTKENRPDRWAVWSEDFGFFAYGKTLAAAEADLKLGVATLVGSFGEDLEELRKFLATKEVEHHFYAAEAEGPSTILQELEAPAGPVE